MKLSYSQLEAHLVKHLMPIYLIASDEILLAEEARSLVRIAAEKKGYTERIQVTPETLYQEAHSTSLFAAKRVLELSLRDAKPPKLLEEYALNPAKECVLIILTSKLDAKTEKAGWFKAVDKNGITLPLWPITKEHLPSWISQRAKKIGLNLLPDAIAYLAEQVEGNLLSASQEIEKLSLLFFKDATPINQEKLAQTLADTAHFDIYDLVDSAITRNHIRSLRILANLKAEGVDPILILWALTREIRNLAELIQQTNAGKPLSSLFSQFRIFPKRQGIVRQFIQQHSKENCWSMLNQAAKLDKVIKGIEPGAIWDELEKFLLFIDSARI